MTNFLVNQAPVLIGANNMVVNPQAMYICSSNGDDQAARAGHKALTCSFWKKQGWYLDSKFMRANMGPTWGRQDPGGPHIGPMNLAIWGNSAKVSWDLIGHIG